MNQELFKCDGCGKVTDTAPDLGDQCWSCDGTKIGPVSLSKAVDQKFEEIKRLIASAAKWHEEHGCLESMYDSTEQAQEEIVGGLQTIEPEQD